MKINSTSYWNTPCRCIWGKSHIWVVLLLSIFGVFIFFINLIDRIFHSIFRLPVGNTWKRATAMQPSSIQSLLQPIYFTSYIVANLLLKRTWKYLKRNTICINGITVTFFAVISHTERPKSNKSAMKERKIKMKQSLKY